MKSLILLCSLFVSTQCLNAQIKQGNWLAGMTGNFRMKLDENNYTSWSLNPSVGLFILNRLAIGTSTNTYFYRSDGMNITTYGLGPYMRYYFFPSDKKINLFLQPSFSFSKTKYDYPETTTPIQLNPFTQTFTIAAGPSYFINEFIALEMTANHVNVNREEGSDLKYIEMRIGLQVHLGGKRE